MADFTDNKITQADIADKGVMGLPDVPGLTDAEMQAKFEEIVRDVVINKFNALIDALNGTDLEGHVIENSAGTDFAHRTKLAFSSNVLVVDDPENNRTYLTILPWEPTPEDLSAQSLTMLGYVKPESTSAIVATDNVSQAVGKLEKKADDNAGNITTVSGSVTTLSGTVTDMNTLHTFTVETTDWTANTDPDTSAAYPYIATISCEYYTDDSTPIWDILGADGIPTEAETEAKNMIEYAWFDDNGVILYANDQPASDVVLRVKGV